MAADAFQLVIVFTVVPVLPFTVLQAHHFCGSAGACVAAALLYGGYPAAFGALMWMEQSKQTV